MLHVLELERELQSPACRADETRLRELLAPDFVEVGGSERVWDLDTIVAMLRQEPAGHAAITLTDLSVRVLAPDVIQVFWTSERGSRTARRTSIWCQRDVGWQQVYHQGTPTS